MRRTLVTAILARFGKRICNIAVVGGGGEGANRVRVRGRRNCVEKTHVGNVVEVDLGFKHDGESFSIKTNGENGGREGELANNGRPLLSWVSAQVIVENETVEEASDAPWYSE